MSRAVREDFEILLRYLSDYNLKLCIADEWYTDLLSMQHKRYLAVLTLTEEFRHQKLAPLSTAGIKNNIAISHFHTRLEGFSSDIGSALFGWIHGANKLSRLAMRSAIENFAKCIGVIEHTSIVEEKRMYEVLALARSIPFFQDKRHMAYFDRIHARYSELCLYAHTATEREMESVGALSYFPRLDQESANAAAICLDCVITNTLEILCLMFPYAYQAMHHRNRDVVNISLTKSTLEMLNQKDSTI